MLIERTIQIDGHTVTITQRVDTGGKVAKKKEPKQVVAAIAVELGGDIRAPLEMLRSGLSTQGGEPVPPESGGEPVPPESGGEPVPPESGGNQAGGTTVVFGSVIFNCCRCKPESSDSSVELPVPPKLIGKK